MYLVKDFASREAFQEDNTVTRVTGDTWKRLTMINEIDRERVGGCGC